jgi:hypothetical protein
MKSTVFLVPLIILICMIHFIASLYAHPLWNVFREFEEDMAFRLQTGESSSEPCASCRYQWICPSPSDYERVLGIPNLCHFRRAE